ncbi:Retrovirus-related Pol polyprotein from transposon TNT 1-94-like protein [Drosera capensis]
MQTRSCNRLDCSRDDCQGGIRGLKNSTLSAIGSFLEPSKENRLKLEPYIHDDLTETVYILQPSGYETAGENHVCRLRKSLYRLKQSPQAWFEKFRKVVQVIGFSRSSADSSLFVHRCSQGNMILLIYVDDIIITEDDTAAIVKMKIHLSK